MKECYLYKKLGDGKVQCQTCNHFCKITKGKRGICGVRENSNGKLYLLVYGKAIAVNIDPIEKKPLYHFMPGTQIYSIATVGCNFRCSWCQNDDISQASKSSEFGHMLEITGEDLPPKKVVENAKGYDCPSIAYTYTEPTIFLEYALDCMKLAKKQGLKNVWVSNGFMSSETLKKITPYLDAINVDLKGFRDETYQKYCGARLKPVLENLRKIAKSKIHLEVTTLVIPGVNDSEKELKQIAKFIAKDLEKDVPWHISRFFPAFKMMDTETTPLETLDKAEKIAKSVGLKNIHKGNI